MEDIVKKNEFLRSFKENFTIIKLSEDIETISSTKVRQAIRTNNIEEIKKHLVENTISDYISFIKENKRR